MSLRQEGRTDEAWQLAVSLPEEGDALIWKKRAMGWVLHDYLKAAATAGRPGVFIERMKQWLALELPADEKMMGNAVAWQVFRMLHSLKKQGCPDLAIISILSIAVRHIPLARPSEVYSALLKALAGFAPEWTGFVAFLRWWDIRFFRPEDFGPEVVNGRSLPSLVERVAGAMTKTVLAGVQQPPEGAEVLRAGNTLVVKADLDFAMEWLETLCRDYPRMTWLPYHYARLLMISGGKDPLKVFLPFARKKQTEFWVWSLMAGMFPVHSSEQTACYCRAVTCKTLPEYLVKVKHKLASLFIRKQQYAAAKKLIMEVVDTRKKNGWKISGELEEWLQTPWYRETTVSGDTEKMLRKLAAGAESLLYLDLPVCTGVINHVDYEKKTAWFIAEGKKSGSFKYERFGWIPKPGCVAELKLEERTGRNGKYLHVCHAVRSAAPPPEELFRKFSGKVRKRDDRPFAMAGEVFIPPLLVSQVQPADGAAVSGTAVLSYNRKKERWGWSAVSLQVE